MTSIITVAAPPTHPASLFHVPDVVWAAVLAALISLCGVMLSNRNSRRQLQMQLDADADQQRVAREIALRRDVYLPVAEAVTRIQSSLSLLADLDTDANMVGRNMVTDMATMAKVHAVATETTVAALMKYQSVLTPAIIELHKLRAPLVQRRSAIAQHEGFAGAANAEVQQFLQVMKQYNLAGNTDRDAWGRLQRLFESEQKLAREHNDKAQALRAEQMAGQLTLAERSIELIAEAARCIPDLVIAAREELKLPIDPEPYRAMLVEQQRAGVEAMKAFIAELRTHTQVKDKDQPHG